MTRIETIQLNAGLQSKELKVKFLTAPQYAALIGLKRTMNAYLNEMYEDEQALAKDMDVKSVGNNFETQDEAFFDKLKEIQKKPFDPKELNFIALDDFKNFTNDLDFESGAYLAEFLLTSNGKE